ncbi:hypothetical protein ZEAMMB73_Zm00001d011171 [Zea mays]|uniref:Uncharacterized protein n=1 Tax=Zea mays TaxID=4577 RepID=A0A1D6FXL2_MAIZE|nr:hypothetical protein ZEAMMB73_Zm00001d011171 [Zea mays]
MNQSSGRYISLRDTLNIMEFLVTVSLLLVHQLFVAETAVVACFSLAVHHNVNVILRAPINHSSTVLLRKPNWLIQIEEGSANTAMATNGLTTLLIARLDHSNLVVAKVWRLEFI